MSYQSRGVGVLTPRKRKEEEALDPARSSTRRAEPPLTSDRLLASYMAYEFLANGTLLGDKFEPDRAGAEPLSSMDLSEEAELSEKSKPQSYFEAANLVRSKAVHVAGVVNPTQLARWIQN